MEGYCITCQKIVAMKDVKSKTLKNQAKVYEGKCETCETVIYKRRGN
jgi:uncharacterized protein YlaI